MFSTAAITETWHGPYFNSDQISLLLYTPEGIEITTSHKAQKVNSIKRVTMQMWPGQGNELAG